MLNDPSARRFRRTDRTRPASLGFLTPAFLCWVGLGAAAPPQDADPVQGTRAVLEELTQTQRTLSGEKRDWALSRELLRDRIDMVQREIEARRASIADATAGITETDGKIAELTAENERLKQASAAFHARIVALEGRVRTLLTRLPEPIRDRVKVLSQRLPADSNATDLSLSERYQYVVGILNEINKFQREVAVTSEVRELEDGTSAEVTALYVGLGQAYYVTFDGLHAGVGRPGDAGWVWTPANESAPAVQRAVAIVKGEEGAAFVPLPVRIEVPAAGSER